MKASRFLSGLASLVLLGACKPDPPVDRKPDSAFTSITLVAAYDLPLTPGDGEYTYRSGAQRDLNGDGRPEAILSLSSYPKNNPNPLLVIDGVGPESDIAEEVFPKGVPVSRHANQVFFRDVNGDGLEDLLFSEAGIDYPPWTTEDSVIELALARTDGTFEDVSSAIPPSVKGKRAYSLAAGDF